MQVAFQKYQATGNDFVIIDNREQLLSEIDRNKVKICCDRHFGIGADGLILLENSTEANFKMVYFNADGAVSSMCGNGGRCITLFAHNLGIAERETVFMAHDGLHQALITEDGAVRLKMGDVIRVETFKNYTFLDSGSPHHVQMVDNLADYDVKNEGARLRYGKYGQSGSNINFVQQKGANIFSIRTYERGVENETLSCGTGAVAVAIAMYHTGRTQAKQLQLLTPGGVLWVDFKPNGAGYQHIYLQGSAVCVFKGQIKW